MIVRSESLQGSMITSRSESGHFAFQFPENFWQVMQQQSIDTAGSVKPSKPKNNTIVVNYQISSADTTKVKSELQDTTKSIFKESFKDDGVKALTQKIPIWLCLLIVLVIVFVFVRRGQ